MNTQDLQFFLQCARTHAHVTNVREGRMPSTRFRLLADIVAPYPGGFDLSGRSEHAVRLIVGGETLPPSVSKALDDFVDHASEEGLRSVQEAVARSRLVEIGSECFVQLVARLMMGGQLTSADAAALLPAVPRQERAGMARAAAHLVEVAEAVLEDAKDDVMAVDDDQLLREAVGTLVSGG